MAVIPYGVSTELDAVNSILMSVGETPVNTLTVQSPEVAIAQKTLRQICRETQAEGWTFNTENQYPIELDTNNQCIIPNNVLQIEDDFTMSQSWTTINNKGDSHHEHNHPNTILSCVYYAQADSGKGEGKNQLATLSYG